MMMKWKKILMCYLLITPLVKAANVYTGIEIGGYRSNLILDYKVDVEGYPPYLNALNSSDSGCNMTLLLGIKKDIGNYYIASELFVSKENLLRARSQEKNIRVYDVGHNTFHDLGTYRFQVDMLKTIGGGILGGIKYNHSIRSFVSLDVVYTDFQLTTTTIDPLESIKHRKYLWGVAPGIGLEYAFNEKFSARLSYKINIYEKFNAKESDFDEGFIKVNSHFKPFVHMLKIGLIYHF
jgi:hypothetical protein